MKCWKKSFIRDIQTGLEKRIIIKRSWYVGAMALLLLIGTIGFVQSVKAGDPKEIQLDAYSIMIRADRQQEAGQKKVAAKGYQKSFELYSQLADEYPDWQTDIVAFRVKYCRKALEKLGRQAVLPEKEKTPLMTTPAVSVVRTPEVDPMPEMEMEIEPVIEIEQIDEVPEIMMDEMALTDSEPIPQIDVEMIIEDDFELQPDADFVSTDTIPMDDELQSKYEALLDENKYLQQRLVELQELGDVIDDTKESIICNLNKDSHCEYQVKKDISVLNSK